MRNKKFKSNEQPSNSSDHASKPEMKTRDNRKTRRSKPRKKEMDSDGSNDPAWYATNPELLRDAASIPFSWSTGLPIEEGEGFVNGVVTDSVPGVITLELLPVIGKSLGMDSPVNVAANAIYSFVRHANSGHSNYDASDQMIYLTAMGSVYSYVTWCQRLLGLVMSYDQRNRYMPDALIRANSVNPTDLRNNIANFRFWLNSFINKVGSMAVPSVMPYFNRLAFLYSNYYIDGPTIKDQLYMYVPFDRRFFKFALDSDQKGKLTYAWFSVQSDGLATVEDLEDFGDQLFDAIWEQEDFGIMSGDILKAYGDNIIKISPVPEMFILQPIYDTMVLHQMKNAKPLFWSGFNVSDVTQGSDGVIRQIIQPSTGAYAMWNQAVCAMNKIITSDFDHPTPEVIIESTRLMPGIDLAGDITSGTEMLMGINTYYATAAGAGNPTKASGMPYMFSAFNEANIKAALNNISTVRDFKYHPELFMLGTNSSATSWGAYFTYVCRIWDIDNYAVLSKHDVSKMHMAALMSLFAVPSIAKIQ